jgi:uncharacterized protein YjbJ (UPF0337 family)
MELLKVLITNSILFLVACFVNSQQRDCSVPFNDLDLLKTELGKALGDNQTIANGDCEAVKVKLINFSSRLKNTLKRKIEATNKQLIDLETNLNKTQWDLSSSLAGIDDNLKAQYGKIFVGALKQSKSIRKSIEKEHKRELDLQVKKDFYLLLSNSQVQSETSFCSLSDEKGERIISLLGELAIAITSEEANENCQKMIKKMINVNSLIKRYGELNEKKTELINKCE